MTVATVRNGVDVDQLVQTIDAIKGDESIAGFTFKADTRWKEGSTSVAEISSFTHAGQTVHHSKTHVLTGCEPEVLLGRDRGPNAVELVLAALGFCYSVGFVYNAAALGYELEELSYEVEGDLDLRNFVGIEAGPRPGFSEIRVKGRARAKNASQEDLDRLCRYVQDTSPVKDILINPVPVKTTLEISG
ncbi:MAG: OsmC family protein [Actinomycetota bacterium]